VAETTEGREQQGGHEEPGGTAEVLPVDDLTDDELSA